MNHWTMRTAAVLALTACAAIAQDRNSSTTATTTPPTPAQQAAKLVARLTTLLDLTSTQQTSATPIFTTEFTSLQTIQTGLKAARTALTTDIESNNTSGIATDAQTIGTLTQQSVEARGTADAAFYALLTTPQQTKLGNLKQLGFGDLGGGGHGGYGGHR